ncbi:MAG: hypothetical protein K2G21_08320 [Muribaculaceae bacterium]|nr:hypothetical protein [Muribaculaceae bacterium]
MITIKTIWMAVMGSSLAVMLIYRLIMMVRHMMMNDQRRRPVHRRV